MNIINNRTGLELGPNLNSFRAQTLDMTPKDRGFALDKFDHVRDVHNSFATELDKLNVDMRLKQDYAAAEKEKKAAQSRHRHKKRKTYDEYDDEDNGFHFVAYAPAAGSVWKMDGMERLPRKVGNLSEGDSWVAMVLPELQAQLESATNGALEFSLLALTATTDVSDQDANRETMARMREDWGPFISTLIRIHVENGTLKEALDR
jgi:ubiquitin carboxyl-terminal hydrolase L5